MILHGEINTDKELLQEAFNLLHRLAPIQFPTQENWQEARRLKDQQIYGLAYVDETGRSAKE